MKTESERDSLQVCSEDQERSCTKTLAAQRPVSLCKEDHLESKQEGQSPWWWETRPDQGQMQLSRVWAGQLRLASQGSEVSPGSRSRVVREERDGEGLAGACPVRGFFPADMREAVHEPPESKLPAHKTAQLMPHLALSSSFLPFLNFSLLQI